MPFCSSCGTENQEMAKFCASCGTSLLSAQPAAMPNEPKADPGQDIGANKNPKPQLPIAPLSQPERKAQSFSHEQPNTQFFIAAAQVSTTAKLKKVIVFLVGAILLGTVAFLFIQHVMTQEDPTKAAMKKKQAQASEETSIEPTPEELPKAPDSEQVDKTQKEEPETKAASETQGSTAGKKKPKKKKTTRNNNP